MQIENLDVKNIQSFVQKYNFHECTDNALITYLSGTNLAKKIFCNVMPRSVSEIPCSKAHYLISNKIDGVAVTVYFHNKQMIIATRDHKVYVLDQSPISDDIIMTAEIVGERIVFTDMYKSNGNYLGPFMIRVSKCATISEFLKVKGIDADSIRTWSIAGIVAPTGPNITEGLIIHDIAWHYDKQPLIYKWKIPSKVTYDLEVKDNKVILGNKPLKQIILPNGIYEFDVLLRPIRKRSKLYPNSEEVVLKTFANEGVTLDKCISILKGEITFLGISRREEFEKKVSGTDSAVCAVLDDVVEREDEIIRDIIKPSQDKVAVYSIHRVVMPASAPVNFHKMKISPEEIRVENSDNYVPPKKIVSDVTQQYIIMEKNKTIYESMYECEASNMSVDSEEVSVPVCQVENKVASNNNNNYQSKTYNKKEWRKKTQNNKNENNALVHSYNREDKDKIKSRGNIDDQFVKESSCNESSDARSGSKRKNKKSGRRSRYIRKRRKKSSND